MFAYHDQLMVLIESFYRFSHQPICWFLMIHGALDGNRNFYRIADKYRADEPKPLIPICHGSFIDHVGRQTDSDAEDEGAMRDPSFKRLRLTPFFVHMMREKVSGLSCMKDNIRLCDRAAGSLPALVDGKVFKM